jgi:signal transduction histidine kinase
MKLCHLFVLLLLAGLFGATVQAEDRATAEEARTMAMKAAQYLRESGPEMAFAAFNAKDGPWHDRDLYVLVLDQTGKMLANGGNAALIGRNLINFRDVDGNPMVQEITAITDAGWVEYKWQNPTTKTIDPKTTYVVRVGNYSVGVGAYK